MTYYNGTSYIFTWKNGRQLAAVSSDDFELEFVYNDEGIRTQKIVNDSEIHTYHRSGTDIIAEEWGSNLIVYLYDSDGSPMGMQYRRNSMDVGEFYTFWFEKNLQGDIVAVYNSAGIKVISYSYDAWGNCTTTNHNISGTNSYATYNPFRYRGYYYDSELGFYYLNSRYYDSAVGRFINADTLVSTGQGILGYNMFAYCNNEPVFQKDSQGTEPESVENKDDNDLLDELVGKPSGGGSVKIKGINSNKGGTINHKRPTVIEAPESSNPTQMKKADAVDAWDDYLGNQQTNYNPYKGVNDPNRIFSSDGTRSIRFGNHEMDSWGTSKAHFHFERWEYNAFNYTVTWYSTIQRLK